MVNTHSVTSMTGFASGRGEADGFSWGWDLRAVNGKGLDLRLRVPDWVEGLEQALRAAMSARIGRGNVTLSLRLARDDSAAVASLNETALARHLETLKRVEQLAVEADITLSPSTATDVLAIRGVQEMSSEVEDTAGLRKTLMADFAQVLDAFCAMRAAEGEALQQVISGQLDRIETLVADASTVADARKDDVAETLRTNVAKLLENTDGIDEARLTQELALLAVKTDVTEELDRLRAHIDAARKLLATDGPIGRKLDFLMQEFNREANTLCSKSQSVDLTALGLDLKATIDQMREQVQNVE